MRIKTYQNLLEINKRLREEIRTLQNELSESTLETAELSKEAERLRAERSRLENERDRLMMENQELRNRLSVLEAKFEGLKTIPAPSPVWKPKPRKTEELEGESIGEAWYREIELRKSVE